MDLARIKRLTKEAGWIISGQVIAVLGSLVLVRVLTEYLEPARYGELALGLTVAALVNQVVMGGVTAAIGRFYSIAIDQNDLAGYLHASRQLLNVATWVVAGLALLAMAVLFWLEKMHWAGVFVAALVLAIPSGYNSSLGGIQNAARQRALVAFHGGLDAWLRIVLAVGMILWLGGSGMAVLIGYALSSALTTASQFLFLSRTIRGDADTETSAVWRSQMWAYAWPFSVFGVFTWMQQISDRWALQTFSTAEDLGFYAVVFQIGYAPIGLLLGMVMSFLGPIFYQRAGDAADDGRNRVVHDVAWRVTLLGLIFTGGAFFLAWLLHGAIFHLLVAERYRTVSHYLPWMVLAGGVFASGQMLALKLMAEMRPGAMTAAKVTTAIGGVALNIFGSAYWGMQGVVMSLVIFSIVYFIWLAVLARRSQLSGVLPAGQSSGQ